MTVSGAEPGATGPDGPVDPVTGLPLVQLRKGRAATTPGDEQRTTALPRPPGNRPPGTGPAPAVPTPRQDYGRRDPGRPASSWDPDAYPTDANPRPPGGRPPGWIDPATRTAPGGPVPSWREEEARTRATPRRPPTPGTEVPRASSPAAAGSSPDRPAARDPYPSGYRSDRYRQDPRPDDGYREARSGYPQQGYSERGYPDLRDPDSGYRAPSGQDRRYPDPRYPDPRYPEGSHADQSQTEAAYPDHAYPEAASPGQRYTETGFPHQGYPEAGYPDQGYPEAGYPDQGYPEAGYPDQRYPEGDYPRGGYPDAGSRPTGPDEQRPPEAGPRRPPPRGSHLPPYREPLAVPLEEPLIATANDPSIATGGRSPRKLTVTRVAALRSRELTHRGVQMFQRATTADGADKSGLTHLTYAVMGNYAVDAALTVALANTIFFADTGSTGKVLSYLVITVAPFAVVAPFIGPMLDRLQSGRRLALALSSFGRALLALVMVFNFNPFNPWVIYPCALGNLVLSKAFSVLKAALTPRVLPEQITLVKTNSRLTVFGLMAGGVAGLVAAGMLKIAGSPGALVFTTICGIGSGILCLRIPAWVESTEGEVPLRSVVPGGRRSFPLVVTATLWANAVIRVETGFLALFIAFVVKNQYPTDHNQNSATVQLLLLGIVGVAAGVGGFLGNALGARLNLSAPEVLSILSLAIVATSTLVAAVVPGLATAAIVGLVGSTASSLAKVCLDSVIQHHLPEASRASAFGKSESVLQLAWVFGGVLGLLIGGVWFGHLPAVYTIGFSVITLILLVGLAQCWLLRSGRSMLPKRAPRPDRGSRKARKASAAAGQAFPPGSPGQAFPAGSGYGGAQGYPPPPSAPTGRPGPPAGSPDLGKRRIRKAGNDR